MKSPKPTSGSPLFSANPLLIDRVDTLTGAIKHGRALRLGLMHSRKEPISIIIVHPSGSLYSCETQVSYINFNLDGGRLGWTWSTTEDFVDISAWVFINRCTETLMCSIMLDYTRDLCCHSLRELHQSGTLRLIAILWSWYWRKGRLHAIGCQDQKMIQA